MSDMGIWVVCKEGHMSLAPGAFMSESVPLILAPVLAATCMLGAAKEGHFRKKGIWLRIARGDAGAVRITCHHTCVGGSI